MPFKRVNTWLFNFFHFNKQERNGVFTLSVIIILLIVLKFLLPYFIDRNNKVEIISFNTPAYVNSNNQTDSFPVTPEVNDNSTPVSQKFVFNPNTATEADLRKLGFSAKLSKTVVKYRSKGGKFYKPTDLKKLYGLSPKLYSELEPYVLIPNLNKTFKKDSVFTHTNFPVKKAYVKTLLEINSADSLSIVYLKGIGPAFTKRIIKYRALLGGFHSVNQLKEVWGMTDSVYTILTEQVTLNETEIKKIPINVIDFNTLKKHPYFNFQSAQTVINYRSKHGRLTAENFKDIGVFSEEKLRLILPYLAY